jgi:polyketide synthase PksJ
MLHRGQRVPFLSGQEPMKHYPLEASPFHFCRSLESWAPEARQAAINCFADGGTNAHVILRAWPGAAGALRKPLARTVLNRRLLRAPKAAVPAPVEAHALKTNGMHNNGNGHHPVPAGPVSSWKRRGRP